VQVALSGDGKPGERLAAFDVVRIDVLQDAAESGRVRLRVRNVRGERGHQGPFAGFRVACFQIIKKLAHRGNGL
jgi:hypothetical protein